MTVAALSGSHHAPLRVYTGRTETGNLVDFLARFLAGKRMLHGKAAR